ncbi:DUF4148 domain-containing protein [Pigmentiphaga litoralis]|uniref:DUF4148 domain-containing protein n=1 Tax=Pigmentiphaga litoralis TaxID=516702 RepID=UPI003B436F88
MTKTHVISALSATLIGLAAFGAQAQEINRTGEYPYASSTSQNSQVSAAQVHQELMQAKARGEVVDGDLYGLLPMSTDSDTSYAQTKQQLLQSKADGYYFNNATYPVPGRTAPRG